MGVTILKKLRQSTFLFFCAACAASALLWIYLGMRRAAWLPFVLAAVYYAWRDVHTFREIGREEFEERRKVLFSKSMKISGQVISAIETESLAEIVI